MRARDIAEQLPLVTRQTDAVEAARVIADHRMAGLVVADDAGTPVAVLAGPQLLRLVVPHYVLDDPRLAHVYDEKGSDEVVGRLREHTLAELLDDHDVPRRPVPTVLPEDTLIEIASLMCQEEAPVVLVRDRDGSDHGVVTMSRLMAALLETAGETPA